MKLKPIIGEFTVCKLSGLADLNNFNLETAFWFLSKTDEELSLVCETNAVPINTIKREDGFQAFRIEGVLDFSLVGILSVLSKVLADQGIGIFAVSTFNTDYILVKKEDYEKALYHLEKAGYTIMENQEEA